jgi:predicted nucleic acid-binding protein
MKIFLDTSSLFKLYHLEAGTQDLMDFFKANVIDSIFLAEITKIEFSSAVWKKCRKREIDTDIAQILIDKLETDSKNFSFIEESKALRGMARDLIGKHWEIGLRTLDSIQLASVLTIKTEIEFMFTTDIVLSKISLLEGLKVK